MASAEPNLPAGTAERRGGAGPARFPEPRWFLLIAALVAGLLAALDIIPAGLALVFAILLLAVALFAVRSRRAEQAAGAAERNPAAWPETGVKLFAEALADPCFLLDRRGVVRYANAGAAAAFRARPGEPLSYWLRVPELTAAFERVARGGPAERVEFVERVPTERWYAAWFSPLGPPGEGGQPAFVVLIMDDLTEGRRIERVRVDFVANASHELRTPLASLAGFIETLQGPARDDPDARERFLRIMHDQATRMSRLIADLLSLSRIELKAHVRPSDPVDLAAIVRHVTDALEPLARDLGVTIEARLPPSRVMVAGERDELIQVVENLVENACKYGQSGKRVVVTLAPGSATAGPSVSIRDFGPGIAAEHLPRLTERFYRVDVEASRQHRGTGLGLAIVKHIVARHGGRLTVESEPGDGAEFTVTFPQGPDSAALANAENIEVKSVA
jgi:two-component system, OmpR family, phosphate regulon sensor histidine kinase PhoR